MRCIHNFVADAFYFILEPAITFRFRTIAQWIADSQERIESLESQVNQLQNDLDNLRAEVGE